MQQKTLFVELLRHHSQKKPHLLQSSFVEEDCKFGCSICAAVLHCTESESDRPAAAQCHQQIQISLSISGFHHRRSSSGTTATEQQSQPTSLPPIGGTCIANWSTACSGRSQRLGTEVLASDSLQKAVRSFVQQLYQLLGAGL